MPTVRIAVASTPLTATLDEAVPAAVAAIEEAGRLEAQIVCLPETGLPGHRGQARPVPDVSRAAIDAALEEVAAAARAAGVVTIVGAERPTPAGREIVAVVLGADGTPLGVQAKTQIDPSEEPHYAAGAGRHVFTVAGVTFGIAICHEGFRYPEIARSLVLAGAQVVFAPHHVTTADGSLPARWCDASNPYNEKALMCRALENSVYVAASNVAGPDQGSATCIIAPDGSLLTSLAYGAVGVAWADVDLDRADRLVARRWAPGRNMLTSVATPALSTIPDRRAFAGLYAAEGQQMDNLCGCFWGSLALRAAGIDADQEAVALEAGAILPGGDPITHVAPGATPRCDYRVELPLAAVPASAGTAAPPLAAAIERLSADALAAIEIAGPWSAEHVCALLDAAAPAAILIANVRTGLFWGSRPDPAVVVSHLTGGSPEPPPADWDVGHFVELAALVRGPAGALVVVRDTYRELGLDGHHLQPPDRVAAALRRDDGSEGGVLVVCAAAGADVLRGALRDEGFDLRGWDNGTPQPSAAG
jgi:predicted amidohydrolase